MAVSWGEGESVAGQYVGAAGETMFAGPAQVCAPLRGKVGEMRCPRCLNGYCPSVPAALRYNVLRLSGGVVGSDAGEETGLMFSRAAVGVEACSVVIVSSRFRTARIVT